ncbi:MAG: indolepyruvate ferredoxin oxidoreductase subunit alpha [Clostridia bacterium]
MTANEFCRISERGRNLSQRVLLSGNEAIALGAHFAGVHLATGYPGTPSTEILEALARSDYPDTRVQWAVNEKVALEVGIGASLAGRRALVTMKHVGVNVAADPLMTASYVGVKGGLVVVTADDPGMHSSQNEQDNRNYARFAKIPVLEPSDSQEAHDFVLRAFQLSEIMDTPVLLRSTTRISHSRSPVEAGPMSPTRVSPGFESNLAKYVMIPGNARGRRRAVAERSRKLEEFVERSATELDGLYDVRVRSREVGIITGGIAYQYVREALPDASVFKLGLSYPLPVEAIREFSTAVEKLYVIEELDPFWETELRAAGISIESHDLTRVGELNPTIIGESFGTEAVAAQIGSAEDVPPRPPVLCPGCPHRGVFYQLSKRKYTVTGDIGCYSLGALPPLNSMDTCICMGASIGNALGIEKALGEDANPQVAVIGDSTFLHSGMTALADVFFNGGNVTTIILDNRTTAMTGHQGNPTAGYDVYLNEAPRLDFESIARGLGITQVVRVDPFDLSAVDRALKETQASDLPSVIIADAPCALLPSASRETPVSVTDDCTACGTCLTLGCPALKRRELDPEAMVEVDPKLCTGCGLCAQVCPFSAITTLEGADVK